MRMRRSYIRLSRYGATVSELDKAREQREIDRKIAVGEIVPERPAPAFDPLTLTLMQQAALLMMAVGPVKWALYNRLTDHRKIKPTGIDFRVLSELGLAEWKRGKGEHDATDKGRQAIRDLIPALCIKLNVHLLTEGGRTDWQVRYRCDCGFSCYVRASKTALSNAQAQHHAFVTTREGVAALIRALRPPVFAAEAV